MTSDISVAGDPLAYPHLKAELPASSAWPGRSQEPSRNLAGLARIATTIAADRDAWAGLVRFDAERRWYFRLAHEPDHEIWLLSWLPGQRTGLHDHGGASGVFVVAAGELTEYSLARYTRPTPAAQPEPYLVRRVLDTSQSRVFGPNYVHEVVNEATTPAVSVHVYAPALTEMTRYALRDGGLAEVDREVRGVHW
jgi:hypothetical protein